jgi:hypothetical protein
VPAPPTHHDSEPPREETATGCRPSSSVDLAQRCLTDKTGCDLWALRDICDQICWDSVSGSCHRPRASELVRPSSRAHLAERARGIPRRAPAARPPSSTKRRRHPPAHLADLNSPSSPSSQLRARVTVTAHPGESGPCGKLWNSSGGQYLRRGPGRRSATTGGATPGAPGRDYRRTCW